MRLAEVESITDDMWGLHEMVERSRRTKQDGTYQIGLGLTGWHCIARYDSAEDLVTLSEVCTFIKPLITDRESLKTAMQYDAKAVLDWLVQKGYDSIELNASVLKSIENSDFLSDKHKAEAIARIKSKYERRE